MPNILIDNLTIAFTEHDVREAWNVYLASVIRDSNATGAIGVQFIVNDRPRLASTFASGTGASDIIRYAEPPLDSVPSRDGAWNAPVVAFSHPLLPAKVCVAGEDREILSRAVTSLPDPRPLLHALTQSFHVLRAHHAALQTQALFDRSLPTLLIDDMGRIHAVNRHARPFFNPGNGLLHEDDRGILTFRRAKLDKEFKTQLAAYFEGDPITRKWRGNDMLMILNGAADNKRPQLVSLTLKQMDQPPTVNPAELEASLGLTPAQARLAEAMILGETVNDYAIRTGITHKGAKYHLANMMKRLHCSRRDALIRLLLCFAG